MPPPPPELLDELLGEAFLRIPPDDPACLRASLVCKIWRRILADPAFRRRHRELHWTPPVLGFLCNERDAPYASRFVPNSPASGRLAARDLPGRRVLDCRHGRTLFLTPSPSLGTELSYDIVVWDPLTNEQRCLALPSPLPSDPSPLRSDVPCNAAVLCAAAKGCDHRKCHGGPFRVALVWSQAHPTPVMCASVYSSEKDNWSEPISVQQPYFMMPFPSTLVGDTLYLHYSLKYMVEYQLGAQLLSIIEGPPRPESQFCPFFVMPMEDCGLGCMDMEEDESSLRLRLWSREAASWSNEVARWTRGRAIELDKLLPNGALPSPRWASDHHSMFLSGTLLGIAEGIDAIFVGTQSRNNHSGAVYMVQLNSGRARKVFDGCTLVFPYTSFCIPVNDTSSTTERPGDDASRA